VSPELAHQAGVREWASKPVRSSELYGALMQLAAPRELAAADILPTMASLPRPRAPRGRVLVVEDNHVNQLVAQGVLHKLGFTADLAADGLQALAALEDREYDIVLMDCHMPEMDGFQATTELRRREGDRRQGDRRAADHRRTPVIAMTAGVLAEDQERCRAAGMDDFVAKPVDVDALERALVRHLTGTMPSAGEAPATPEPAVSPDALDLSRLDVLRRLDPDGAGGLVRAVVTAFLEEIPTRLGTVRAAAAAGGGAALEQAAHQLKGSAANLGATQVATLCDQLEDLGRSGDEVDHALVDRLTIELDRAGCALADVVAVGA
jgi:CheY-like chemotaxis protein/HPt (histidine-containing phosphotransfer) domain-containing protein